MSDAFFEILGDLGTFGAFLDTCRFGSFLVTTTYSTY